MCHVIATAYIGRLGWVRVTNVPSPAEELKPWPFKLWGHLYGYDGAGRLGAWSWSACGSKVESPHASQEPLTHHGAGEDKLLGFDTCGFGPVVQAKAVGKAVGFC